MTTTKTGKSGGRTITGTTGVTISTANLTDSGNSFTAADVGLAVTGTNIPAATTILSITSPGVAVMSQNATATSSAQNAVLAPNYQAITKDTVSCVTAVPASPLALGTGQVHQAIQAANEWVNAGGAGEHSLMALKRLAAQGLIIAEL